MTSYQLTDTVSQTNAQSITKTSRSNQTLIMKRSENFVQWHYCKKWLTGRSWISLSNHPRYTLVNSLSRCDELFYETYALNIELWNHSYQCCYSEFLYRNLNAVSEYDARMLGLMAFHNWGPLILIEDCPTLALTNLRSIKILFCQKRVSQSCSVTFLSWIGWEWEEGCRNVDTSPVSSKTATSLIPFR